MPQLATTLLEPRKSPIQARSTASVQAILTATIQVLLTIGKEKLTTTRVSARAGVSVGTLYQYFPNKGALLQAALRRHLEEVAGAVEQICRQQKGATLRTMATELITGFLAVKMRDARTSVALYSVSSDVDGAKVSAQIGLRSHKAIVRMLESACEPLATDPKLVAAMLQGMMVGVSRRILESHLPEKEAKAIQSELIFAACAYIEASSARPSFSR